jgi:hypothetical protein
MHWTDKFFLILQYTTVLVKFAIRIDFSHAYYRFFEH